MVPFLLAPISADVCAKFHVLLRGSSSLDEAHLALQLRIELVVYVSAVRLCSSCKDLNHLHCVASNRE